MTTDPLTKKEREAILLNARREMEGRHYNSHAGWIEQCRENDLLRYEATVRALEASQTLWKARNERLHKDKTILAETPSNEMYWIQLNDVLKDALLKWEVYTNAGGRGGPGKLRTDLFVDAVCATRKALELDKTDKGR